MSTDFYYNSQQGQFSVAEVDYKRISGQPGVGFYRCLIGLSLHQTQRVDANVDQVGLRDIRGELFAVIPKGGEILIAKFNQSDQRFFEPRDYPRGTEFSLEAELDRYRIHAIEALRQGADLNVKLRLRAIAFECSTQVVTPIDGRDLVFQVTQSDWIKVLKGMKFKKTILLEIEEPNLQENPELSVAIEHLTTAHGHLLHGHFKSVVAECRNAIEVAKPFFSNENPVPEPVREWLKTDYKMTKEQRLMRIGVLLNKLTSLAHHSDETSRVTDWGQEDAQAVLAMTTALLQMTVKHPD